MKKILEWNELDLRDHNSAASIIFNEKGQILVMESNKHNKLGLPGGKADPGENVDHCLIRETKEEIGIDIYDYEFLNKFIHTYKRSNKYVNVCIHLYLINYYSGNLINKEPELCKEIKWLYPETIMALPRDHIMDNLWEAIIQMDLDGVIQL